MSPIEAIADEHCDGFLQPSCREYDAWKREEDARAAMYAEDAEEDILLERYLDAEAADEWADTYLAAEKADAVYWRNAYVRLESATGTRTGRLGDHEGRMIYGSYVCDPNYDDALSGGCVPADRDYDCGELRSWGIVAIPVRTARPTSTPPIIGDWMLLDDDHDGLGCESQPS
jgi:hypothetical protein